MVADANLASLLSEASDFVRSTLRPVVAELDARGDPEACFSWSIMEDADRRGLRTLRLSKERGGSGCSFMTLMQVVREVAKGDAGVAAQLAQVNHLSRLVEIASTPDQLARYFLPAFVEDPRFVLAIGSTEPFVGSDSHFPPDNTQVQYRTTAVRKDGGWVLNGHKHFINNGNLASLYLIMAQTDPDRSLQDGSECFLVKAGTDGLRPGAVHDKMGERLANHAQVFLEDCWVPEDAVLNYSRGSGERGSALLFSANPGRAVLAGATVLGVAEAAFEATWQWVHERVQGGSELIEHSSIQESLGRMRMQLDAATAYVERAAVEMDRVSQGGISLEGVDKTLAILPKVFCSEVAWDVVSTCLELHGGRGYMRGHGLEKLVRDAASWKHSEGANKTLLLRAVRFLRAA